MGKLYSVLIALVMGCAGYVNPGVDEPCTVVGTLCIRPNAYGYGRSADQYGRPVDVVPAW